MVLDSHASSGQIQPAKPGSARGDGVLHIELEDGAFLDLQVQLTFTFAPHLELPSPYEFTEVADFTLYGHTDQMLHVVETCTERLIDVTASTTAAAPVSPLRLRTYPDPPNPRATIAFELAEPQTNVLTVHQVDGARMATLLSGPQPAGSQEVSGTGWMLSAIPLRRACTWRGSSRETPGDRSGLRSELERQLERAAAGCIL